MAAEPYQVDWDYVRVNMRARKQGESYRTFSDRFRMLSAATCHRFLRREQQLDLVSLLCVMSELNLRPDQTFIRRSTQTELFPRGRPIS